MQQDLLALLLCPSCRCPRLAVEEPSFYRTTNAAVEAELVCASCGRRYPVIADVPVLFSDPERITFALDRAAKERSVGAVADLNRQYLSSSSGKRLRLAGERDEGQLAWEYFYWSRWAGERSGEVGFLEGDRDRINRFLKDPELGAGRLHFLMEVERAEGGLRQKLLLNVGCGRDLLLEHMLDRGCRVVEQDIVLDSLLAVKKRGAPFCVCGDLAELPIADNVVDVLTSFGVLHHVWPIRRPLAHVLRVLAPGGGAHFAEPNAFALATVVKSFLPGPLFKVLERLQREQVSPSPFERCINPYVLSSLFREMGLSKRDIKRSFLRDKRGKLPLPVELLVRYLLLLAPVLSTRFYLAARKPIRR
jgi:SAM-dependent methyltransferase/uncharacterized protein YbaR (Trm112 family)